MTDIETELQRQVEQIADRTPKTQQPVAPSTAVTFPDLRGIEAHTAALLSYKRQLRGVLEGMANESDALTKALDTALGQLSD